MTRPGAQIGGCRPPELAESALRSACASEGGGVIAARNYPRFRRGLYRLVEAGELATVLPGVFAPVDDRDREEIRIRALAAWDDDAVLTRWAAAKLTFWPEITIPVITASVPRHRKLPPGFRLSQEVLPRQLIRTVRGIRVTAPELTALDLAVTEGGDVMDLVHRTRLVSVAEMDDALACTPKRRDNGKRRRALDAARRNPWSAAGLDTNAKRKLISGRF